MNTLKKIYLLLIPILLLVGSLVFHIPPTEKAQAHGLPQVTICHKQSQPWVTITISIAALPAHLAHGDSIGICPQTTPTPTPSPTDEPIPTPTVEPSVSPSPTPTETPDPCEVKTDSILEIDPCATPTPTTVIPTEAPQSSSDTTDHNSAGNGGSLCSDAKPARVANINVVTTGNTGELQIQWALPIGADKVHIEYGLEKNAQYSLLNTSNDGNEVIGALDSGQHYWFRVAGVNGCAVGDYSDWFDPLVP